MLFQSAGGAVGDSVCLYNFFRTLTIKLTLYNVGSIQSGGVIAYLGAENRKTTANATFMIHRAWSSPQTANADRLHAAANALALDDQRAELILRQHMHLSEDKWDTHKIADFWLSGDEALQAGLATEIGGFAPPRQRALKFSISAHEKAPLTGGERKLRLNSSNSRSCGLHLITGGFEWRGHLSQMTLCN